MTWLDKLLGALVVIAVAGISQWSITDAKRQVNERAYAYDVRSWHEKLAGCERTKADRASSARALRAQAVYLNQVLEAKSVKVDVKRAAAKVQDVFDRSAHDLETRTGARLSCRVVYPKPPVPDGVKPRL